MHSDVTLRWLGEIPIAVLEPTESSTFRLQNCRGEKLISNMESHVIARTMFKRTSWHEYAFSDFFKSPSITLYFTDPPVFISSSKQLPIKINKQSLMTSVSDTWEVDSDQSPSRIDCSNKADSMLLAKEVKFLHASFWKPTMIRFLFTWNLNEADNQGECEWLMQLQAILDHFISTARVVCHKFTNECSHKWWDFNCLLPL